MTRNYTALCSFDLSKRLKEAGFPQTPLHDWYGLNGELNPFLTNEESLTAPYFSEVFDWLIEKGIYIDVYACYMYLEFGVEHWVYGGDVASKGTNCSTEEFRSWEEAAGSAIDIALEITEERK